MPDPRRARLSTLFLELPRPGAAWLTAGLLFAAYLLSMSRDLGLFDSAELALVAYQLGLGHPIGQPLHTLLGFVFAHLPFVSPLCGLNMFSALAGALCVLPSAAIAERLCQDSERPTSPWLLYAMLFATGVHALVWEPATRIEVYALGALCTLWAIAFVWPALDAEHPSTRRLLATGVGFGLAACAATYTAFLAVVALMPALLRALMRRTLSLRALFAAALGGVLALVPYAYVPLIARRTDVLIWGAPRDANALARYFTGADFAHNRTITTQELFEHVFAWINWSAQTWLLPLLLIGLCGYVLARTRPERVLVPVLCLGLDVLLVASNKVFSPDVPDYLGYLLVPLWLFGAGAAVLPALLALHAHRAVSVIMVLVFVGTCVLAPPAWFLRTRARDHFARDFVSAALRDAPPRAIVVAETDQFVAAALYLQLAEQLRPDVVVLAGGLASSSWYWELTFARHPELTQIALVAPGGRYGRMRRLFDANSTRPVQFENLELARETGMPACAGRYLLQSGWACTQPARIDLAAARLFERTLSSLGYGSPSTVSAVAAASFALGLAWFELGYPDEAIPMLLAGVPAAMHPASLVQTKAVKHDAGPQALRIPEWRRPAALGDPARNLFVAGLIALEAQRPGEAADLIGWAATDGLPEALDLLTQ